MHTCPVFVLTIDQRGSRRHGDRVPQLLAELAAYHERTRTRPLRGFERTVGDEFPTDHDPSQWTTLDLIRP